MSENVELVVMPVCPFCKTVMAPCYFTGYYESFPMWACECEELPNAEDIRGSYA